MVSEEHYVAYFNYTDFSLKKLPNLLMKSMINCFANIWSILQTFALIIMKITKLQGSTYIFLGNIILCLLCFAVLNKCCFPLIVDMYQEKEFREVRKRLQQSSSSSTHRLLCLVILICSHTEEEWGWPFCQAQWPGTEK